MTKASLVASSILLTGSVAAAGYVASGLIDKSFNSGPPSFVNDLPQGPPSFVQNSNGSTARANATVPIPGTDLLLGMGLIALPWLRSKVRNKL